MAGQQVQGMGAVVVPEGVGFRVWAPHADTVAVSGDFNQWSESADQLQPEENGYWYGFVAGARAGQEYKFVITNGEQVLHRIDPYASEVTNSVGNGVIHDHASFDWEGDDFHCPTLDELVVYELHVGSFNTTQGRVGTFADVQAKIAHIAGMGFNAVELMPVMEFAGDWSWGYNPAHVFAVEDAYGGPVGLKTLVREFHRAGVAVIMDVVYNHFGPSDLDLWQFDGWSEDGKGGIYFYNDWRSATPWGDSRPDYGRPEVRQFIHDNAFHWVENYHADGLRYDMTAYIRSQDATDQDIPEGFEMLAWINNDLHQAHPGTVLIAEDMHNNPDLVGTGWAQGGFDAQWDAEYVHPMRAMLAQVDDAQRDLGQVRAALEHRWDDDAFRRVVYTESHDEVANGKSRTVMDIDPGNQQGWYAAKRATLGTMLTLTAPGIPMVFQGQEFLQGGWFSDQMPLDWALQQRFGGLVQLHGDLARLRRNWFDDTAGLSGQGIQVFHANDEMKVLAFQRWREHGVGDDVLVLVNLSAEKRGMYRVGLPAGGRWELKFNSDSTVYSPDFGSADAFDLVAEDEPRDGFEHSASVDLAPYTVLVYAWKG